jgi:hypothetical protein
VAPHETSGTKYRLAHMAASRRPVLSSGEANGWFLAHNAPKTGLDAPCESRNSRARAPPFVAPPSSTPGVWVGGGGGVRWVNIYICFGPRRWTLVSKRSPTAKDDFELWLDWATTRFRVCRPSSFNTALQLVMRPHFLVHFV